MERRGASVAATLRTRLRNAVRAAHGHRARRALSHHWTHGLATLASLAALSCGSGATDAPNIARVELTPASLSLTVGEARSFTARAVDGQGNPIAATLYWSSENAAIATVSEAGVVTAVGVGSTRIAANAGGKASVATVNVSARPVSSVRISPSSQRIEVGETVTLTASAFDAGGAPLPGLSATWASANPDIATIDETGVVTAVASGVATVSATIGSASGTAVIHVDAVPVATVRITPNTGALLEGETLQLNAEALDAGGTVLGDRTIAWRSNALSVASVSSDGLVVALTPGTVTITATTEGKSATATITVSRIPVAAIEVTPGNASVSVGNTVQFTGLARDKDGNVLNRPLTWTSEQPGVATVSAGGLATAVQQGSVRITATAEGKTGTATLVVNPTPVAAVSITPATVSLQTGDTATLTATVKDASGNVLPGRQVNWLSGAPNIITVSNTGLLTAVGTGSALIFASSEGVSGTSSITVTAPPAAVASITVSPSTFIVQPGTTRQLTATARDAAGNTLTGRPIVWTSSAPNIATVGANGLVTALVDGTATITASNGSVTGSATASVLTPVASITVAPSTASLLVGATRQLSAVGRDALGNVLPGRVYTWISSAPAVATVTNSGLVTAVGGGTATISAFTGGLSGTASITVTVPVPVVASIAVTPATSTLQPSGTQTLTAVAKDAKGVVIPNQSFVWSSSATGVATVSNSGVVTAVAAGSATIKASSAGIDGSASVTVNPAPPVIASIAVSPASASLTIGDVQGLTATALDAAGNTIAGATFSWSSSATSVATVSSSGSVTAIAQGTATVTATSAGINGTASITVSPPVPTLASITLNPSTANLTTGAVQQFTATARDNAGNVMTVPITWSSSATNVATISNTGNVTAVAAGTTTIRATSGSISGTASVAVTAPAPTLASITVAPSTANLSTGDVQQFTATARDNAGNVMTVPLTWTSSATSVATVSGSGNVTAVGAGSSTIRAASGSVSGTASVVVTTPAPTVASISVTPATANLLTGATQQLLATARDGGGAVVTGQTFSWSTSASQVATVSSTGLVTAVGAGNATITASTGSVDGNSVITVSVPAPTVTSVSVTPTGIAIAEGQGQQLVATARDAQGNTITGKSAAWSTSDAAIATVSTSGLLSGVQAGQVTVSAVIDGVTGTAPYTVTLIPVQQVQLSPSSPTINATQTVALTPTVTGPNGQVLSLTGRTVAWSTSNNAVATVSSTGVVTGVAGGSATISLTVDGKVGTSNVTVQVTQPSAPAIGSVAWNPGTVTVQPGQDVNVTVIVRDVNGAPATNRTCTLTSPDRSRATVSPAQANTGSSGTFTALVSGIRRVGNSSPVNMTAVCGGVSDQLKVYVR